MRRLTRRLSGGRGLPYRIRVPLQRLMDQKEQSGGTAVANHPSHGERLEMCIRDSSYDAVRPKSRRLWG